MASDDTPAQIGHGLTNPKPSYARAIALEQTGASAATRTIYVSEVKILYKSTDAGVNFTATPLAPGDFITCIVTTAAAGQLIWAGSFDGAVHCSLDGGASWDAAPLNTTPRGAGDWTGPVNHIAIDPANTQRVAVVFGGVSGVHSKYRTQHVFLSVDGGATWADVSGADGAGPMNNLPDLALRSVVFDTSTSPSALIVAGDAGVLRSTDAAITGSGASAVGTATWQIYGVGLPMVCCNSLAIDNSVSPQVLRVGTYGRSCYEVSRPSGGQPRFASDDNLAFGAVAVNRSVTLPFYVYNSGDAALNITATNVIGLAPFTFGSTPGLPVSVAPGATQTFQVTFAPTAAGDEFVLLQLTTNDPSQATRTISASGAGVSTGLVQRLAANPIATVGFGAVTSGSNRTIAVQLFNVGTADLSVTSISRTGGSSDFSLNPAPSFPIAIPAGGESDITFQFAPSGSGAQQAEFSIVSDDPRSPLKLTARGVGVQASSGFWAKILSFLGIAHP